uniref:Uncharacterized protein n=1 Tax=Podoviridae sp. ctsUe5 TaxID=2827750 RepID=A0A8S5S635_9CAUD|nr:MAG TPA: hypothetical protein [Podoviridae sp. ctsUe5]
METRVYNALIEHLGSIEKALQDVKHELNNLTAVQLNLIDEVKQKTDIEGKLKALAVEVANLKDEKEV